MRTLEEAVELPGISKYEGPGGGLNLHFSPIPNWYMKMGCDCPVCNSPIEWDWVWHDKKPMVTTDITPALGELVTKGCKLLKYGHRWITLECSKCHTQLCVENFD